MDGRSIYSKENSKSKSKFGVVVNRSTSFKRNGHISQNLSQIAAKTRTKLKNALALNKDMAKSNSLLKLEIQNLKSQLATLYATELKYAQLQRQLLVIKPFMNTVSQSLLLSVREHCNAMSILGKIENNQPVILEPNMIEPQLLKETHQNPQLEVEVNDPKPKLFNSQPKRKSYFQKLHTIEEISAAVSNIAEEPSNNDEMQPGNEFVPPYHLDFGVSEVQNGQETAVQSVCVPDMLAIPEPNICNSPSDNTLTLIQEEGEITDRIDLPPLRFSDESHEKDLLALKKTVSQAAAALSSNADFFSSKNTVPIDEDITEIYDVSLFKATTTIPIVEKKKIGGKTVLNVPKEGQTSLAVKDALQNQTPNALQQHQHVSSTTTALAENSTVFKATPTETTNHEAWDMELTSTLEKTIVESDKNKKQALSGNDVGKIEPKDKVTSTQLSTEKSIPQESLVTTKELMPELSKEPIPKTNPPLTTKELMPELSKEPIPKTNPPLATKEPMPEIRKEPIQKTNPPLTTKEPMPELRKEPLPKTNTPLTTKKLVRKKQPRKSPPEKSVRKSKENNEPLTEAPILENDGSGSEERPKRKSTLKAMDELDELLSDTEDESVYEPPKAAANRNPKTTRMTKVKAFEYFVSKNVKTAPKSKTLKASSSTKGAAAKKNTKKQLQTTTAQKDANRSLDEFDLSNSVNKSSFIKPFSPRPRKSGTISKTKMVFDTSSSDNTDNDKTLTPGSERKKTTTVKRLKKKSACAAAAIETDTDSQEDDMVSETNTVVQMKSRPCTLTAGSGKSTVKRRKESMADKPLPPRTTSTKTTAVGRKPKEVKKCEEPQATTSTAIDGNVVRENDNFKVPAKNIGVRTKPKPKDQGKENMQSEVPTASDTTSGRKKSTSGSKTTPLTNNENIKGIKRKLRLTDVTVPPKKLEAGLEIETPDVDNNPRESIPFEKPLSPSTNDKLEEAAQQLNTALSTGRSRRGQIKDYKEPKLNKKLRRE